MGLTELARSFFLQTNACTLNAMYDPLGSRPISVAVWASKYKYIICAQLKSMLSKGVAGCNS